MWKFELRMGIITDGGRSTPRNKWLLLASGCSPSEIGIAEAPLFLLNIGPSYAKKRIIYQKKDPKRI